MVIWHLGCFVGKCKVLEQETTCSLVNYVSIEKGCSCPFCYKPSSYVSSSSMFCYHLSKQTNCSPGTYSGLVIWQPRCTAGASSRIRCTVLVLTPYLVSVPVTQNGSVNCIMPVSYMTPASVPAPVPFPQLSLPICSYHPITPNPYALGQQVTIITSSYCPHCTLCPYRPDHS